MPAVDVQRRCRERTPTDRLSGRQDEVERVAVGLRLDADRAAHAVDQAGADRQPEAGARGPALARDAAPRLEDALRLVGGERGALAGHDQLPALLAALRADLHEAAVARAVLERVGEQVLVDD